MTTAEFSNQFDVLYNNVMSNQAPGLDEYEKSVFLTKAQNEIVLSYFNPKGNAYTEGFDGNERRQVDFSMLMKVHTDGSPSSGGLYDPRGTGVYKVSIPSDVLVFVNETAKVTRVGASNPVYLSVVPINYVEYARQMSKPFKRPTHYQAWRLINGKSTTSNDSTTFVTKSDIIVGPSDSLTEYVARYIKRPQPIVLIALTAEQLSIDGVSTVSECELDPVIHQDILQRAVELAKAAYTGDLSSQVGLGTASQTELRAAPYGGRGNRTE